MKKGLIILYTLLVECQLTYAAYDGRLADDPYHRPITSSPFFNISLIIGGIVAVWMLIGKLWNDYDEKKKGDSSEKEASKINWDNYYNEHEIRVCPKCNGTYILEVPEYDCPDCRGTGQIMTDEEYQKYFERIEKIKSRKKRNNQQATKNQLLINRLNDIAEDVIDSIESSKRKIVFCERCKGKGKLKLKFCDCLRNEGGS